MNNRSENIDALSKKAQSRYNIDSKYYDMYNVKRGLRNRDGSGVMAGFTNISEVHGYVINEDEKHPMPGELIYRGYSIMDLVPNAGINKRYGFEEIAFLLLMGELPTKAELEEFCGFIAENRVLPANFTEDMILKAPSRDIMNKMARSVLALYSYDDTPDDCSIANILRQSLMLLSKMPLIGVYAYNTK
ncbi:MAG: citrate synthase, partial [Clostridia bacterium]|nr:citrate synthase [Clostridia bacterium]